jgi:hypothetical protein
VWYINKTNGDIDDLSQADLDQGQPILVDRGEGAATVCLPSKFLEIFAEEEGIKVGCVALDPEWGWPFKKSTDYRSWHCSPIDEVEKELETAVAVANERSKQWYIMEAAVDGEAACEKYKPRVVQPYMVKWNARKGTLFIPIAWLEGFDEDCPLGVGNPDPSSLRQRAKTFNHPSDYSHTLSPKVWRAWNYTDHDIVRKQLRAAMEYWYEHNTSDSEDMSELSKLMKQADEMLADSGSSVTAGHGPSTKGKGDETMSTTKKDDPTKNAEINWESRPDIALPSTPYRATPMPPEEAAKLLLDKAKEDNEVMAIVEDIADCFPWDGAVQFSRAMGKLHGWGRVKATDTMFGKIPPKSISVEVDPGVFEEVIWGEFSIPGIKGELSCGIGRKDKRMIFSIRGEVIKRDLPLVRKLADLTREYVRKHSIYRGKAIELALDDFGEINWTEQPRFLDPPVHMSDLIYSEEILDQIGTHLIAPVTKREVLKQLGRPFGGAVLISGTYGVGKTVLAAALANVCRDVNVTFISVKSLKAVPDALVAARPLGPCVVFVEDIDRISSDAERNDMTQEIMNTVASVGSKGAEVMAVFTTNRPGAIATGLVSRFNGVIVIDPPKPPEVEKLIRLYGMDLVHANEDLTEASQHLSGKVPRTIEQIVQASKQYAVHRNNVDDIRQIRIIGRDIIGAAIQKEFQLQLESRGDERILSPAEKMGKAMEELLGVSKIQDMLNDLCVHFDI